MFFALEGLEDLVSGFLGGTSSSKAEAQAGLNGLHPELARVLGLGAQDAQCCGSKPLPFQALGPVIQFLRNRTRVASTIACSVCSVEGLGFILYTSRFHMIRFAISAAVSPARQR